MSGYDFRALGRPSDSGDLGRPPRAKTVIRVLLYLVPAFSALGPIVLGLVNAWATLRDHTREIAALSMQVQSVPSLVREIEALSRQQKEFEIQTSRELADLRARLERICARVRCGGP